MDDARFAALDPSKRNPALTLRDQIRADAANVDPGVLATPVGPASSTRAVSRSTTADSIAPFDTQTPASPSPSPKKPRTKPLAPAGVSVLLPSSAEIASDLDLQLPPTQRPGAKSNGETTPAGLARAHNNITRLGSQVVSVKRTMATQTDALTNDYRRLSVEIAAESGRVIEITDKLATVARDTDKLASVIMEQCGRLSARVDRTDSSAAKMLGSIGELAQVVENIRMSSIGMDPTVDGAPHDITVVSTRVTQLAEAAAAEFTRLQEVQGKLEARVEEDRKRMEQMERKAKELEMDLLKMRGAVAVDQQQAARAALASDAPGSHQLSAQSRITQTGNSAPPMQQQYDAAPNPFSFRSRAPAATTPRHVAGDHPYAATARHAPREAMMRSVTRPRRERVVAWLKMAKVKVDEGRSPFSIFQQYMHLVLPGFPTTTAYLEYGLGNRAVLCIGYENKEDARLLCSSWNSAKRPKLEHVHITMSTRNASEENMVAEPVNVAAGRANYNMREAEYLAEDF
ncbi:hypothetical protein B0H34DRAFT_708602 [Crassisporium funariophilum]|nr:hypothetical protein B0H34DRAFT_708602 [Crassisporium funariophilum]